MRRFLFIAFTLCWLFQCSDSDSNEPEEPCANSTLEIHLDEVIDASGCGVQDGAIRFSAAKGEQPYTFYLNDLQQNSGDFSGLASGIYRLRVDDARGCSAVIDNVTLQAAGLAFEAVITPDTDCTGGNGSFELAILEGNAPFEFAIGEGPFQDNNLFEFLAAGNYEIRLRDAGGCESNLRVTVPTGDSGTSWKDTIRPMIETHCALSGCHNGLARPDLRQYDKAKFYASQIKTLTGNGSMPFTGSLTKEQIALIACWVDEGAKDN